MRAEARPAEAAAKPAKAEEKSLSQQIGESIFDEAMRNRKAMMTRDSIKEALGPLREAGYTPEGGCRVELHDIPFLLNGHPTLNEKMPFGATSALWENLRILSREISKLTTPPTTKVQKDMAVHLFRNV